MLSQAPGKLFFPPRGGDFDATKLFDRDIVPIKPALWQNACLNFWAQGLGDFPKAYPPFFTKKIRISNRRFGSRIFFASRPLKTASIRCTRFCFLFVCSKTTGLAGPQHHSLRGDAGAGTAGKKRRFSP